MKDDMPEIIDFLLGSGTLDGWGYGEKPYKMGAFWWRPHLRAYHESIAAKLEAAEKMAEALGPFVSAFELALPIELFKPAVDETTDLRGYTYEIVKKVAEGKASYNDWLRLKRTLEHWQGVKG